MIAVWQTAALVRIPAVGVVWYTSRRAMGRKTRSVTMFLQSFLSFVWTAVVASWMGEFDFSTWSLIALLTGVFNGIAIYLMWNANAISVSKNGFFTAFDDIGAMIITMIAVPLSIVGIHLSTVAGMVICICSALALAYNNWRKKRTSDPGVIPMVFYVYAIGYAIFWGLAIFGIGYLARSGIGIWRFASMWYLGSSLVGAVILLLDLKGSIPKRPTATAPTRTVVVEAIVLAAAVSIALIFQFLAFGTQSLVVLQPVFLVIDVVMAAIIGIRFYGERKQYDGFDIKSMAVGIVGFALIFWAA